MNLLTSTYLFQLLDAVIWLSLILKSSIPRAFETKQSGFGGPEVRGGVVFGVGVCGGGGVFGGGGVWGGGGVIGGGGVWGGGGVFGGGGVWGGGGVFGGGGVWGGGGV